jgi:septal ring factor EnvC (AmiA/AmiB activator)
MVPPVEGRRVLSFGERTSFGAPSKGTTIESAAGAPVLAPATGFVLFAGEWRSYGPLVILDAGCGAEVLLSGVGALTVAGGGQVDRGGRIGKVPEPAPGNLPVVYFEVRRNGAPVDPEQ